MAATSIDAPCMERTLSTQVDPTTGCRARARASAARTSAPRGRGGARSGSSDARAAAALRSGAPPPLVLIGHAASAPASIRAGAQGQQGSSAARLPRGGARARRAGREGVAARAELRGRGDAVHLRRVRLVREEGRDVSSQYGREGGGRGTPSTSRTSSPGARTPAAAATLPGTILCTTSRCTSHQGSRVSACLSPHTHTLLALPLTLPYAPPPPGACGLCAARPRARRRAGRARRARARAGGRLGPRSVLLPADVDTDLRLQGVGPASLSVRPRGAGAAGSAHGPNASRLAERP
jgi:hypothetical protein